MTGICVIMDVKVCMLLVLTQQFLQTDALTLISGNITEDIKFMYRTLPVPPSLRATIEFNVSLPVRIQRTLMGIYTEYPEINIQKQCSYIKYGQLGNEIMHPRLRPGPYGRNIFCYLSEGKLKIYCHGKYIIQDYIPRNLSLSFGRKCGSNPRSLQGLVYDIMISDQNNRTSSCVQGINYHCVGYYQHATFPNLIGTQTLPDGTRQWGDLQVMLRLFITDPCYQHMWEILCHINFPKCDPKTNEVTHPCKEMCWDMINACSSYWAIVWSKKSIQERDIKDFPGASHYFIGCNYLPSFHGNIPCFYKPVTCGSPPEVDNNTVILNDTQRDVYQLHDVIQYSCVNETFQIEGNGSITCQYSGEWSLPPRCQMMEKSGFSLGLIALTAPLILLIIFIIAVAIFYRRKQKKVSKELYKVGDNVEMDEVLVRLRETAPTQRNREFDAFVVYHFDSDHEFVCGALIPKLEQEVAHLKLKVHSRDFELALLVEENIRQAIDTSNNAIILVSNGLIQSKWCLNEISYCHRENIDDPSFKLFVVMMQPVKDLDLSQLNRSLRKFIEEHTYMEREDPDFFDRLAKNLQPEDGNIVRQDQ